MAAPLTARILRITSLFGGLQAATILCGIVRQKLVALWIGAAGTGLLATYFTAIEMICALSQLGLRESAVRDVSQATPSTLPTVVRVVRRWAVALGLTGALLTLILSGLLSYISFGSSSRWLSFALLAPVVWMMSVNGAEKAVFQGLRDYRRLASCTIIGAVGGLVISIPLYWFWREQSIVPSLIVFYTVTWIAMGVYRTNVGLPSEELTARRTVALGKRFILLGIYITASSFITNLISYGMLAFLTRSGGEAMAGYYNAGFTLVNRYVGLVFTAIAIEYYPRLAAVSHSRARLSAFVTNQLFISLAVLVPIAVAFVIASPLIVRILYTADFLAIIPFISLAMAGTVFRAISWCMSFVMLARADGRIFLATEILSSLVCIISSIICYNLRGLTGLGIAYIIWYAAYTLVIALVYFRRYRLRLTAPFLPYALYATAITLL
ncbi:MAG: oligosaccharide flippase family protein, partial [Muribaculaceae bacterium]|nr:oligosaccharide flippase family protein [Muribaculaceae bacterium]